MESDTDPCIRQRHAVGARRPIGLCSVVILSFVVFFPFMSIGQTKAEIPGRLPQVLYINSYHPGYSWSDTLAAGIARTLEGKASVYTEYLDGKRSDYDEYEPTLISVIAVKYGNTPIDVVLTSDDAAFRFVRDNRETLFKGIPVVTCGINYMTPEILAECPGATGVMEGGQPLDTARLAMELFPKSRQIIFITEYEYGDRADEAINTIKETFGPRISYLRIRQQRDTTLDDIIDQLKAVDKPSVVVFFGITYDTRTGEESYVMKQLTAIGLPIFVFDQRFVQYGALGGIVQDGEKQGEAAARMVLQLLEGTPVEQIPAIYSAIDKKVFDYAQLKRFRLLSNPLMADAVLLGRPDTRLDRYRNFLAVGIIFIGLEALLIAILIRTNRIRLRTAMELEAAKTKAESALQAKSDFLMMVSHELRTPLNAIDGFTELLKDEKDEALRQEYLQNIKFSSKCQLDIINDILEFTNAKKEPSEINTDICDITGKLSDLVSRYQPEARKNNLDLVFHSECPETPHPRLNWDYLQLAVSKLIENAMKFSKQGCITVHLTEVCQPRKHSIVISVIDQGLGIDEKKLEELVELFGRADYSLTREHPGMGLGLALCQRFATG